MGKRGERKGSLMNIAATKSAARRALEYAGELIAEARYASLRALSSTSPKRLQELRRATSSFLGSGLSPSITY